MKARYIIITLFGLIVLTSCVTKKKLTYLQYNKEIDKYAVPYNDQRYDVTPYDYKLMPSDILFVRVITPDPQWSALFNSMPTGSGGAVTEESAQLLGYPIDRNGDIEIPFVGKVEAAGKTVPELKVRLDSIFKKYVNDGAVAVRLVNNYVTIIGEVRLPGRYPITKDRLSIFEALSTAGDIDLYGNRHKIKLIRPSSYGPMIRDLTLSDRSIITSEYYYIMPNDIIYVPPMAGKGFQSNAAIYTLFLTTITTALVILGYFKIFSN
jgi:polysaccharide biosynthesis/export protein